MNRTQILTAFRGDAKEKEVVGPSAWNDLPFELRSLLVDHPSKFHISLKSFFVRDWAGSASSVYPDSRLFFSTKDDE